MTAKRKRVGEAPTQGERYGERVGDASHTNTNSIAHNEAKVKQICDNLRNFSGAIRYAVSRGERYVSLPMTEEDAVDFEACAEMLEEAVALLCGAKEPQTRKREPVGEFRSWAQEIGSAELYDALGAFEEMRRRKKKPLTDVARHRAICKLKELSSDPQEQAEIVLQSVDHSWDGFFPLKDKKEAKPQIGSTFDTDEFFEAALAKTMRLFK